MDEHVSSWQAPPPHADGDVQTGSSSPQNADGAGSSQVPRRREEKTSCFKREQVAPGSKRPPLLEDLVLPGLLRGPASLRAASLSAKCFLNPFLLCTRMSSAC